MHELSITEGILKIAVSEAAKYNVSKVLSIKLKIGELSGVIPDLIQEYFNIISSDTVAHNAKIIVERVPGRIKCLDCEVESPIERMRIKCPACGSFNVKIIAGREYYVDSMEVE